MSGMNPETGASFGNLTSPNVLVVDHPQVRLAHARACHTAGTEMRQAALTWLHKL